MDNIYKIIVQNMAMTEIKNINISQHEIINDIITLLVKSGNPLNQFQKSELSDECIIAIRHSGPMYYLYNQPVCHCCLQIICRIAEQFSIHLGQIEYTKRRDNSLWFRKAKVCQWIDIDIIQYIYTILIYKI